MQDSVEITLPVSGKKVTIRNYTTRADDAAYESELYQSVNADDIAKGKEAMKFQFPLGNMMKAKAIYVYRLVKSFDGETSDISSKLDDLHSEDYSVVEEKINEIVEQQSPKVKRGNKTSENSTKQS